MAVRLSSRAAQTNALSAAKWLVERGGAKVDQARNDGVTPLIVSSQNGHAEVVKLLLANGAKVNQISNHGFTSLFISREYGHREVVRQLLDHGANVDEAANDGGTALIVSSGYGHREVVKLCCPRAQKSARLTSAATLPSPQADRMDTTRF